MGVYICLSLSKCKTHSWLIVLQVMKMVSWISPCPWWVTGHWTAVGTRSGGTLPSRAVPPLLPPHVGFYPWSYSMTKSVHPVWASWLDMGKEHTLRNMCMGWMNTYLSSNLQDVKDVKFGISCPPFPAESTVLFTAHVYQICMTTTALLSSVTFLNITTVICVPTLLQCKYSFLFYTVLPGSWVCMCLWS